MTLRNIVACLSLACAGTSAAAITVTVDPAAPWVGYMNVFNRPQDGGAFQFGSGWGTADLRASFSGNDLTLSPNTIGDPSTYWYVGGGAPGNPGNKQMDASFYIQTADGSFSGQTVTFTGMVLSNSLTSAHTAVAFIKDFATDYSTFNVVTAPLVNGVFSISMDTAVDPTRHIQYGFETIGVNVWATDVAPFGQAVVTAIPEMSSTLLGGLAATLLIGRRRRC